MDSRLQDRKNRDKNLRIRGSRRSPIGARGMGKTEMMVEAGDATINSTGSIFADID